MSISTSPAAIVRLIAKERPTILYDEIDAVFGNAKAQEANADLRSVLNGGYRRGAKVHRCTTHGKTVGIEALDAFCAVAVAGLRELPDTIASRAIIIRMKRRAPDEVVTPFRHRYHVPEAKPIREALEEWRDEHEANLIGAEPEMPPGIEDRDADAWEPLLAVADEAGDDWPERAREAAAYLTRSHIDDLTKGVELLSHVREAFGDEDKLHTSILIQRLCNRDESPWMEINYGKQLNERGLAVRLKPYGIKSKDVRIGEVVRKGYAAEDFWDVWVRYLPSRHTLGNKGYKGYKIDNKNKNVADVADVAQGMAEPEAELDDDAFEERAAILEYDGGLVERREAEAAAAEELWPELPKGLDRRKQ